MTDWLTDVCKAPGIALPAAVTRRARSSYGPANFQVLHNNWHACSVDPVGRMYRLCPWDAFPTALAGLQSCSASRPAHGRVLNACKP
jgi:hypothetical protein